MSCVIGFNLVFRLQNGMMLILSIPGMPCECCLSAAVFEWFCPLVSLRCDVAP